ncbi:MAG TPA: ABC transporter substrate-binding protein [Ktedonobacterales bacterium]
MPDRNDDAPLELPSGTVTFLFSDIEGSTKLLQRLGERYAEALGDHQRLLRQAWADHHGVEIDTAGDGFFVVFARATDALAAAAQSQRALSEHVWPTGAHLRVRMGLHTGVGRPVNGRYVGIDVHRAARIAAAGHGGQVLLSQATRDQVAKELVTGAGIRDLGRHRLKDLPRREEIYQLTLPGLPTDYPPLKTLDAWPGLRADLAVVALISVSVLAVVGLFLPLFVPVFPRAIGLCATGLLILALVASLVARPVGRALVSLWRDARKPFASITSGLLTLVVVVTTLFITKPPIFISPKPQGYDFTYAYHAPARRGGAIVVGTMNRIITVGPPFFSIGSTFPMWDSCVIQLPDLKLGLQGWKPDLCVEVPTVANGGESIDGKTTIFHIDPRATWSDGVPITAADFLFWWRLQTDPNVCGCPPFNQMRMSAPDSHTVRIEWATQTGDYLSILAAFTPVPLHVYVTGKFAGAYNPQTGSYNSALAQQATAGANFYQTPPVDSGPFMLKSFVQFEEVVLVRNPHFFSNFLHTPALDQITFVSGYKDFAAQLAQGKPVPTSKAEAALIAGYRSGAYTLVDGLAPLILKQVTAIPAAQVVTVPGPFYLDLWFNERTVAPNAQANGGTSIFADRTVRQAFLEAFDRCLAVSGLLGARSCADPNLFTDEPVGASFPDYDPTFHLPGYRPAAAAALLDHAGYRVVDGVRRCKDGKTPIQLTIVLTNGALPSAALVTHMEQDWSRNLRVQLRITNDPNISSQAPQNSMWRGNYDLIMFGDGNVSPDPVGFLAGFGPFDQQDIPTAQDPSLNNTFGIMDSYVAQRDLEGRQVLDFDQRVEIYRNLDRYFAQQFYMEVLYAQADVALVRPTLCNFKQWPSFWNDTWNSADWYLAPSCA